MLLKIFSDNKCACKLYADDLKLYTVLHADEDCGNVQDKLNWMLYMIGLITGS